MKSWKMIDLFAGIGGIRLGFELANKQIKTVFSNEIDPQACLTYKANHGDDPQGDITKIKAKKIPDFDILAAGFPCQAFSHAGKRLGFEDTRGTLFFDVARIIKAHKPPVIFLENVKGLTTHDKGQTFKVILHTLDQLGYATYWKLINAKEYGVPQKRERIYIIGFNKKKVPNYKDFTFPLPQKGNPTIADILEKNVDIHHFISKRYWTSLKKHREKHEALGHGFGYEIIPHDAVANTIVVGGSGRERNLVIDTSEPTNHNNMEKDINTDHVRTMTVREWSRIQGYPDSFKFPVSNSAAYKQLGNSVVVPVISLLAKQIFKVLKN